MPKGIFKRKKYKSQFRKNVEELREFIKENDIKLLGLWEYIRRRNYKKIKKETIFNVKNNT
jgi:ABC-type Zn uptake system ZnuABC Zn-binding protein ZnuA